MATNISQQDPSIDQILDYIFQEISEEEEQQFEKFLDENEDYAAMVDGLMSLCLEKNLSRAELEKKLKTSQEQFLEKVNDIISDYEKSSAEPAVKKEKGRIIPMGVSQFLRIAIVLFILAMPAAGYFLFIKFNSSEALVLSYLEKPYDNPSVQRSGEKIEKDWEMAVLSYRNRNYDDALAAFEKLINSGKANGEALFYAGLCNLYKPAPDPAIAIGYFERVLETKNLYNEQAQWYLSLACFQSGKVALAKENLTAITHKQNHYKKEEAAKLLKKLR